MWFSPCRLVSALVFLALGVIAFTRPASRAVSSSTSYSQQVRFGYGAARAPGTHIPRRDVQHRRPDLSQPRSRRDGEHRFHTDRQRTVRDRRDRGGPPKAHRTRRMEPHDLVLTPPTHFSRTKQHGCDARRAARAVAAREGRAVDRRGDLRNSTIAIVPRDHLKGTVAGHPIDTSFAPALSFQLGPTQLVPVGASAGSSSAPVPVSTSTGPPKRVCPESGELRHYRGRGRADQSGRAGDLTHDQDVALDRTDRIRAVLPVALYGLCATRRTVSRDRVHPVALRRHDRPDHGRRRSRVACGGRCHDQGSGQTGGVRPAVDPAQQRPDLDTYMVNDEGTVYRYQVKPSKVVWGDWSKPTAAP